MDKIHEILRFTDTDLIHIFFDREDQARAYMRPGDEYLFRVWHPTPLSNPLLRLVDYREPDDGGHGFWLHGFDSSSIWIISEEKGHPGWPDFFRMDYATPAMIKRERQRQSAAALANPKPEPEPEPLLHYDDETGLYCFLDCFEDSVLRYAFFKSEHSAMTAYEISAGG